MQCGWQMNGGESPLDLPSFFRGGAGAWEFCGLGKCGTVEALEIERHEGVPAPVRTDRDSPGAPTSSSGGSSSDRTLKTAAPDGRSYNRSAKTAAPDGRSYNRFAKTAAPDGRSYNRAKL